MQKPRKPATKMPRLLHDSFQGVAIRLPQALKLFFKARLETAKHIARRALRVMLMPAQQVHDQRGNQRPRQADKMPAWRTPPPPPAAQTGYRATPVRKNMGTNTMQIASVETNAGTAICCAPSRMACLSSFFRPRLRSMFSSSTVASSTRIPTASASPPRVMMLKVSPSALSTITEVRIESGMEIAMISVLRQLPRNSRIMAAVRQAAVSASLHHSLNRRPHKQGLVEQRIQFQFRRQGLRHLRQHVLTFFTMSMVEAPPFFSTLNSVPRTPSCRTMLVCGEKPSRTWATSRT